MAKPRDIITARITLFDQLTGEGEETTIECDRAKLVNRSVPENAKFFGMFSNEPQRLLSKLLHGS